MNPQMQQYRHGAFPQGQPRGAPAARGPGECDSSTNRHSYSQGSPNPAIRSHRAYSIQHGPPRSVVFHPSIAQLPYALRTNSVLRQTDAIYNPYVHTSYSAPPFHLRHLSYLQSRPDVRPWMQPNVRRNARGHGQPRRSTRNSVPSARAHNTHASSNNRHPQLQRALNLHNWIGGPMPVNAAYAHPNNPAAAQVQQMQHASAQQRHALLEHQSAQRRAKKPTDKTLPDGVDELLVTPSLAQQYRDLRDAERRLDYSMMRKRTDLQDTFNRTVKRQKTMRVWITNTAESQPWQGGGLDENAFDFTSGNDPVFRVKIEGRLLEEPEDDIFTSDDENEDRKGDDDGDKDDKKSSQKFTHFFKGLAVEFDRARQGSMDASMQIEWKKPANFSDVDALAFQRRGDENMNISINLVRDENPERYRLSHALAHTLDMEEADRAETVMGLWEYVKVMGLQEDEEKRSIRCDESLRQIFGREQVYFPQIPELIMPHLHPLPPVKLPYTIRVDQAYVNNPEPTVYDIRVSVDDPIRAKVVAMIQNPEHMTQLRQIARLDDELAVVMQEVQHSKAKHAFCRQMSRDPAAFVNKWMSSQRRDLEVILGEAARGGGEDGMGSEFAKGGDEGVWGSDLTREAVRYLLAKNVVSKS